MKSTKDNRPAVKFSDIVKELHSYANSEQAVIDFASELEKVINLPEEFELSQYYFEDNDAKNYLRKKLNFKSVILTGIKNSTTTVSNIKDDFFEIYKDCYHKYVKSGNPFFNRLSIMYDLNLYYDIEQKKFVIYEATNVGYPGDFEFYSKKTSMELILVVLIAFSQYLFLIEGKIQTCCSYALWTVWKVFR